MHDNETVPDPVEEALLNAPLDDEPPTEEDLQAIEEAWGAYRRDPSSAGRWRTWPGSSACEVV